MARGRTRRGTPLYGEASHLISTSSPDTTGHPMKAAEVIAVAYMNLGELSGKMMAPDYRPPRTRHVRYQGAVHQACIEELEFE